MPRYRVSPSEVCELGGACKRCGQTANDKQAGPDTEEMELAEGVEPPTL
jgi:hypothetical protein